jgi:hypothetical protein
MEMHKNTDDAYGRGSGSCYINDEDGACDGGANDKSVQNGPNRNIPVTTRWVIILMVMTKWMGREGYKDGLRVDVTLHA